MDKIPMYLALLKLVVHKHDFSGTEKWGTSLTARDPNVECHLPSLTSTAFSGQIGKHEIRNYISAYLGI